MGPRGQASVASKPRFLEQPRWLPVCPSETLPVAHLPGCDVNRRRRWDEFGEVTESISLVLTPPHPMYIGRPRVQVTWKGTVRFHSISAVAEGAGPERCPHTAAGCCPHPA